MAAAAPVLLRVLGCQAVDELLHRRQLLLLNQIKLLHKVDKVLERRVQMRLFVQADNLCKE